jgi:hypothetical protein
MRLNQFGFAAVLAATVWGASGSLLKAQGDASKERADKLSVAEFEKLHEQLQVSREPWEAIPWRLSIVEACSAAAKDKKPVYMLVRSGHPLGCV